MAQVPAINSLVVQINLGQWKRDAGQKFTELQYQGT
jgi:hypothetical protein